jgi:2,3-bisphosphoglycerate-independent phosphoglycerate mutase
MASTKYVILVGDGMADRPGDFPGGRTPLVTAPTPNLDLLAARGETGRVKTIPDDREPGSDVANMALLGYDPGKWYTGRAPLEAAAKGIDMAPGQVAYRCNLVHLEKGRGGVLADDTVMGSYSAGHITTAEATEIILDLERILGRPGQRFYPGVSYRHLLMLDDGPLDVYLTPPHDISGRPIGGHLPAGKGEDELLALMKAAAPILAEHPVNRKRAAEGKTTANSIWLWGQGTRPGMPAFREQYGLTGAVVSAVDLVKGIGRVIGLEIIDVPGATGWLDTNYTGKVTAALDALNRVDLVFLHVEAPDEAGHQGDAEAKVRAIADFDAQVVGPVLDGVRQHPDWAVMALADHPTPLAIMTHSREPVPWAILRSSHAAARDTDLTYDETSLGGASVLPSGEALMRRFLGR